MNLIEPFEIDTEPELEIDARDCHFRDILEYRETPISIDRGGEGPQPRIEPSCSSSRRGQETRRLSCANRRRISRAMANQSTLIHHGRALNYSQKRLGPIDRF